MFKIFTKRNSTCLAVCIFLYTVQSGNLLSATITDFKVPENFRFTRDIYFGTTTRPDVSYLQNILNMSTSTRVATSGPGSFRSPSNYYGVKTQSAVDRFQTIFSQDIAYERSISTSSIVSTTVISSSTLDIFTRAVLDKLVIIYSGDRSRYLEYIQTGTTTPTTEEITEIPPPSNSGGYANTGFQQNNTSSGGTKTPHEFIYQGKKLMFTYSPTGQLLKAIGGQELVDTVFSYTPAGQVGQLTGTQAAAGGAGAAAGFGLAGAGAGAAGGAATGLLNFGGITTAMVTCTCSANILLYVQDVRGPTLPLIYQPGVTILYKMYQPRSGVNVLGQYVAGGQCLIYAGTGCTTGGTPVGTMTQLGTSLTVGK